MAAALQALRVLIVEDDSDTAQSTSLLLRLLGCEAEAVCDATAALERAPQFRPDAMLIDLGMPRFDGLELARQFRFIPEFRNTPMIAVTGFVDPKHRQLAFDAGFDGFISKPFSIDDLETACCRIHASIARTNQAIEESKAAIAAGRAQTRGGESEFWLNRQGRE